MTPGTLYDMIETLTVLNTYPESWNYKSFTLDKQTIMLIQFWDKTPMILQVFCLKDLRVVYFRINTRDVRYFLKELHE